MKMNTESILNYRKVSEWVSSSGQPCEEEFQVIAAAGFEAVINLAMPDSDKAIPEEGRIVTALGMSYHHIPVPFDAPACGHLTLFIGLMEALGNKKVWVHCVVNYRASGFLYLYRRRLGMPETEARQALLAQWEPNPVWREFMRQALAMQ